MKKLTKKAEEGTGRATPERSHADRGQRAGARWDRQTARRTRRAGAEIRLDERPSENRRRKSAGQGKNRPGNLRPDDVF